MKRTAYILALMLFISLLLYLNAMDNGFVYDDNHLIADKEKLFEKGVLTILGAGDAYMSYRPVRYLSYMIDYSIAGVEPWVYHLFNAIYHAIAATLLTLLAGRLLRDIKLGLLAGLILLCHPVNTEVVAYASGRRDVLMAVLYLGALLSFTYFLEQRKLWYLALSAMLWSLALGCKEMAYTLPGTMGLIHWTFYSDEYDQSDGWFKRLVLLIKKDWWIYAAGLLVVGIMTYYKVHIDHVSRQVGFHGGGAQANFLTMTRTLVHYISLEFFPIHLMMDYSGSAFPFSVSLFVPRITAVALALVLILVILGTILILKRNFAGFIILWFFITLTPVMHFIPHHDYMAEHYLYLPGIAFALLFPYGIRSLGLLKTYPRATLAALSLLLVFFSIRTIDRNRDWQNGISLYRATIRVEPTCSRAWANMGIEYQRLYTRTPNKVYLNKSLDCYNRSIALEPDLARALNDRTQFLKTVRHLNVHMDREIILDTGVAMMLSNRALVKKTLGDFQGAITDWEHAVILDTGLERAHLNLGLTYHDQGNQRKAVEHFVKALKIKPIFAEAGIGLGKSLFKLGKLEHAQKEFEKVLSIDPRSLEAHQNLAVVYLAKRDCTKAIQYYRTALSLGAQVPPVFTRAMNQACGDIKSDILK